MTKHVKKVMKEVEEIEYYECDGCGEKSSEKTFHSEFGKLKIHFGYGSEYDSYLYKAHVCDNCFKKIQQILPNMTRELQP